MPLDQRIYLLISLKLAGEATPEELQELQLLMKNDPELQERIAAIEKVWNHLSQRPTGLSGSSFEKHLQRINSLPVESIPLLPASQHPTPVRKLAHKKNYKLLLAGLAASFLLFWLFFNNIPDSTAQPISSTVATKPGDKASINLPDGSRVWLNGDSRITYSENIENKTREVTLSGEAFFEVAKDKTRPFFIHTRTITLKVLGTAFNVRSYDNEKETEAALVHGSVEVTLQDRPDQKIILRPGEKLLVKNAPADSMVKNKKGKHEEDAPIAVLTNMHYYGTDSSSVETSWAKNQLVFNDESLGNIGLSIGRWFNVRVTIVDESLKTEKFTATIDEDDKLEDFLEALKLAEGFHYSIKNKEVIISRSATR
jgi:transmembrane sensor